MATYEGDEPKEKKLRVTQLMDLFVQISRDFTKENFLELKIICSSPEYLLPDGVLDEIEIPAQLFHKLYQMNKIDENNTSMLKELLCRVNREDLVNKYLAHERDSMTTSSESSQPGPSQTMTTASDCQLTEEQIKAMMAELVELLQKMYLDHFKNHKPIPWNEKFNLNLEEVYTQLRVKNVTKGKFKVGQMLQNVLDIFKTVCKGPDSTNRISVEGDPAIGKSTLCGKIAYEWARGQLKKFDLVFFLEMRHVTEGKVIDEIFNQLLPKTTKISKEALSKFIEMNAKSILFIFDGLDEIKESKLNNTEIKEIIEQQRCVWCTVLVTTRPHLCDKYLRKFGLYLEVKGFTAKRMREYVYKYFKDSRDKKICTKFLKEIKRQKIENKEVFRKDLLANPLHVSFLCIHWVDCQSRKEIQFPTSLTGLYTEILDCILRRYCTKEKLELRDGELPDAVIEARDSLVSDSYKLYCDDRSDFIKSDISSDLSMNLGLLVRDTGPSRIKIKEVYFFYHKTWFEYFTALQFVADVRRGNFEFLDKILPKIENHLSVLKFVGGSMGREETRGLFRELTTRIHILSEFNHTFDTGKFSALSNLWSACMLCSQDSEWEAECMESISKVTPQIVLFRATCKKKFIESVTFNNIFGTDVPCVHIKESVCSFDCLLHFLELQVKYRNRNCNTRSIENLIVFGADSNIISLLANRLQWSIHLNSLFLLCFSKLQQHYLNKITRVVENLISLCNLSIFILKLDPKACHDSVVNATKHLVGAICQNRSIQTVQFCGGHKDKACNLFTEKLLQNGPRKVVILCNYEDCNSTDCCEFIKKCKTTCAIDFNITFPSEYTNYENGFIEALRVPSGNLKSFSILSNQNQVQNVIEKEILDVLSTNNTFTEMKIGVLPSTAVKKVSNFIKHNSCVKELRVEFSNYIEDMWDPLKEALKQNTVLQYVMLCREYNYSYHSEIYHIILGAVQHLFLYIIRSIQANQCMLKSITFSAMSKDVGNENIAEIHNIISCQQKPSNWSYEYNVSPFLIWSYGNTIAYKHTVCLSVQNTQTS